MPNHMQLPEIQSYLHHCWDNRQGLHDTPPRSAATKQVLAVHLSLIGISGCISRQDAYPQKCLQGCDYQGVCDRARHCNAIRQA